MLRYLDASIVIDGTEPNSPLYPVVSSALRALPLDETCVSDLVRLECLVQATRGQDGSRIALLDAFLGSLVDLPLNRDVFNLAIQLRAGRPRLKTPDALHLAAAIHHGCGEFWTNDQDLLKAPVALTFRTF